MAQNLSCLSGKILTVVVPAYDMEAYLPKCLESLVVADHRMLSRFEVIVVNDGSKDRTGEIAAIYEKRYPDVFRVINKDNGHYGSCVNRGLSEARGTYVKVLDADDFVDTAAFGELLAIAEAESGLEGDGADLIVSEYAEVRPDGVEIGQSHFCVCETPTYTLNDISENTDGLTIHSICYKTSILREMGYRQTEGIAYTDLEWIIEPMARVRKVRYLPRVVTHYLFGRQGQSVENKTIARDFRNIMQIVHGLIERYPKGLAMSYPYSRAYYCSAIRRVVRDVYYRSLIGYGGHAVSGDLAAFDSVVRTIPEMEAEIGLIRGGTKRCQIPLVVAYRKGGKAWKFARRKLKIALALATIKRCICTAFSRFRHGI